MAKATPNKSAAIREALAANPDKGPTEVAAILKSKGFDVSSTYVSVVKSTLKKRSSGGRKARRARVALRSSRRVDPVRAAAEFVKAVGGIESAKAALTTVEMIGKVLAGHEAVSG